MRIVFLGTPEFAVPTLDALAGEHEIVLVLAQPDKPAGRGLKMQIPAVAAHAKELGLPLLQPLKIREGIDAIAAVRPDLGIVVAYGKVLPPALLSIPTHGFLNVHGSLLPSYRGAAPIQRAIEHGETETGVTIMRVDEQLDHGPMLAKARTAIGADERTPAVATRLSRLGADALASVLRDFERRTETPQDDALATHAPKIEKSEGEIRWTDSTASIYNRFRAFDPWPGIAAGELKVTNVRPAGGSGEPGTVLRIEEGVIVATRDSAVELLEVQRSGKSRVAAAEFARSAGWRAGSRV